MSKDRKVLLGLIGAGIQRSLTPLMHEEEARHHGLRLHYQLIDLTARLRRGGALPAAGERQLTREDFQHESSHRS